MSGIVEATGPIKHALISASTGGDNTLVAAVAGKKIRVLSLFAVASGGANTLTFESGTDSGELTGAMDVADNGQLKLDHNPGGWFETSAGELLNLILATGNAIGGMLTYQEVD